MVDIAAYRRMGAWKSMRQKRLAFVALALSAKVHGLWQASRHIPLLQTAYQSPVSTSSGLLCFPSVCSSSRCINSSSVSIASSTADC